MLKYVLTDDPNTVVYMRDENSANLMEREGFEFVGEVELDKKGKEIKADPIQDDNDAE